jgi:uncharacterized protein (TIGR02118 family)
MIKVSVFYPRQNGTKFDLNYFTATHLPLLRRKFGEACKGIVIDRGVRGAAPQTQAPFVVVANMMFESIEAFQNAFRPNAAEIADDVARFTNIRPVIQISETGSA